MDKHNQINTPVPSPKKDKTKLLAILLTLATLCVVGLVVALWWCVWRGPSGTPSSSTTPAGTGGVAATGPCYNNGTNELPPAYTWYENADLGYKFAYPAAWGAVNLTVDHMGGLEGHYVQGTFASNPDISFGGNGTDYIVQGRDGMFTDNPGFLEANSRFYSVQIWRYNDGSTTEPQEDLYPITEPTVAKDGCNTKAAVTQNPFDDFFGYSADVARINLQPTNLYYGVNFVLKNPTSGSRADLDTIIRSFQLIP